MKTIISPAGRVHLVQVHAATYRGFQATTTTWCGIRATASWTGSDAHATCGTCERARGVAAPAAADPTSADPTATDATTGAPPPAPPPPGPRPAGRVAPDPSDTADPTSLAAVVPPAPAPPRLARITLARPRAAARPADAAPLRPASPSGVPREGVDWSTTPDGD